MTQCVAEGDRESVGQEPKPFRRQARRAQSKRWATRLRSRVGGDRRLVAVIGYGNYGITISADLRVFRPSAALPRSARASWLADESSGVIARQRQPLVQTVGAKSRAF